MSHLFIHCGMSWNIWCHLQQMVEMVFTTPPDLFAHWLSWNDVVPRRKQIKKGLKLIWNTEIWAIWRARNNVIFNSGGVSVLELVEEIKVLSWRCSISRLKIPSCLYFEWCWNPKICLRRQLRWSGREVLKSGQVGWEWFFWQQGAIFVVVGSFFAAGVPWYGELFTVAAILQLACFCWLV